jgi:serine/threonine protein kinase
MHDLHLIHTDLKPENILLVSSEYIKVPDYKVMLQRFGCMLFSFFILHFPQDFKYVSASLRVEMT